MRHLLICALALGLAVPVVGQASATSDDHTRVTVRLHDTDLERPKAAAQVLRRLDSAAMEACGASDFSLREYRLTVEGSACHEAGLGRAVAELNVPAVTALYDKRASVASVTD